MAPRKARTKTINFDKNFNFALISLRITRTHPDIPHNTKWLLQSLFLNSTFVISYLVIVYNIYLSAKMENYEEASQTCAKSFVFYGVAFQYFIIISKQDILVTIFDLMKADYVKPMAEEEKDIVLLYVKKGRLVCLRWLIFGIASTCVTPIMYMLSQLYVNVTGHGKVVPIYVLLFPSRENDHILVCLLVNLILLYNMLNTAVMMVAFPPLGPMFMLHASGQLEIVKTKLLALYVDKTTAEIEIKLKDIVKHVQYINEFVNYIQDTFGVLYELTLKAAMVGLPINMYEVYKSQQKGEFNVEFTTFIIVTIMFCSTPCYFSDLLMDKGEEVRQAMYSCGWEKSFDHGVRRTLLVMLANALNPIVIQSIFCTVCLDALTDVFKNAYAIFNLITAFSD